MANGGRARFHPVWRHGQQRECQGARDGKSNWCSHVHPLPGESHAWTTLARAAHARFVRFPVKTQVSYGDNDQVWLHCPGGSLPRRPVSAKATAVGRSTAKAEARRAKRGARVSDTMEAIDPAAVRSVLDHVLASQTFVNSGRLSRMLRFVVEHTLDGQSDQLKEYLLGVEVFDRPPEYDPRLDSIVRVEARRLRAKLSEYYETDGAGDALRIRLAKGGYAPTFERVAAPSATAPSTERPFPAGVRTIPLALVVGGVILAAAVAFFFWPTTARVALPSPVVTVAVLPFHVFSGRDDDRRLADPLPPRRTRGHGRGGTLRRG